MKLPTKARTPHMPGNGTPNVQRMAATGSAVTRLASAEPALVLVVGMDLAAEAAIPLAAEKAQDVLGSEGVHGVVEHRAIQVGQGRASGEQQVGGVLGLIDDPVHRVAGELFAEQGIDLLGPTIEGSRPVEPGEAVGKALC